MRALQLLCRAFAAMILSPFQIRIVTWALASVPVALPLLPLRFTADSQEKAQPMVFSMP